MDQIPVILAAKNKAARLRRNLPDRAHLVASNGIFEFLRCPAFNLLCQTAAQNSGGLPGLLGLRNAFRFKLPLVPRPLFASILAFCHHWHLRGTEVEAILDYNLVTRQYQVVIPQQIV
ncbi:MAG: hypothetical protein Q8P59_05600, partial [Dehalococcoidia bacterium]|nr:hypothetical protein [Dehalococcoidia bacterium]